VSLSSPYAAPRGFPLSLVATSEGNGPAGCATRRSTVPSRGRGLPASRCRGWRPPAGSGGDDRDRRSDRADANGSGEGRERLAAADLRF